MTEMIGMAGIMRAKLIAAFTPTYIEVIDESDQHAGHGGWREAGETHFRIVMQAPAFAGMGRIERSRAVHRTLAEELSGGVHALALDLSTPR